MTQFFRLMAVLMAVPFYFVGAAATRVAESLMNEPTPYDRYLDWMRMADAARERSVVPFRSRKEFIKEK
jgi:hypothetical protein